MDHISVALHPIAEAIERERKFALGLFAAKDMTTAQLAARIISSFGENGARNIANAIIQRV